MVCQIFFCIKVEFYFWKFWDKIGIFKLKTWPNISKNSNKKKKTILFDENLAWERSKKEEKLWGWYEWRCGGRHPLTRRPVSTLGSKVSFAPCISWFSSRVPPRSCLNRKDNLQLVPNQLTIQRKWSISPYMLLLDTY